MKERNHSVQKNSSASYSSNDGSASDPYNCNNFMAPPIGAQIKCVTCLGNNVQGKVVAYDQQTKMLALSKISCNLKKKSYEFNFKDHQLPTNLVILTIQ